MCEQKAASTATERPGAPATCKVRTTVREARSRTTAATAVHATCQSPYAQVGPILPSALCVNVIFICTSRHGRIARPSVRPRKPKPRPWRDIAILACPPPPEPSIPARSRSTLAACRPSVHVSHARDRFTVRLLYIDTL